MSLDDLTPALRETRALFEDRGAPLTTTEAADRLDLGRRSTYERLTRLVERGELETKKVGASARIWWRPSASRRPDPTLSTDRNDGAAAPSTDPASVVPSTGETGAHVRERAWDETALGPIADWSPGLQTAVGMMLATAVPVLLAWGPDRTCLYNDAAAPVVDESPESLGRPVEEVLTSNEGAVTSLVDEALGGESGRVEGVMLEPAGSTDERYFDLVVSPVREIDGTVAGALVIAVDVTEQKRAETELRENEELLRLALEAADIGAWELDLETEAAPSRSPQHDRIFGYDEPLDDWSFERFLEHVHPEDRDRVERSFEEAFETGSWSFQCRILRTDGVRRWIEAHGKFYFDGDEPVRAVGNVRDITDRVTRERTLEEARQQYRTLIENFPNGGVALVDEDLRYVSFGGMPAGSAELDPSEFEGQLVEEALSPAFAELIVPCCEAALEGTPSEFETAVDDRVYQFFFLPVRDDDGTVFAAIAMSQDVTDRKDREQRLRAAKAQLEAATEAGGVGTWEWHVQEDRLVAGPSFARTFGVSHGTARTGVPLEDFTSSIHADDRERVENRIQEAVDTCGEYEEEYRVRDADGELRWMAARGRVECDGDGTTKRFPGVLVDITERKRAERKLEEHRAQLEALNSLQAVVREITDAVIEQSSREEIEAIVCERLAAADSYVSAWIGDVDVQKRRISLRTHAGTDDDPRERVLEAPATEPEQENPALWVLEKREMRIVRAAGSVGTTAVIPIVHSGTCDGVLCVDTDRETAFTDDERSVIGQLGEIVGHAIAAIERQRALFSDTVRELEFRVTDFFESVGEPMDVDGTITHDRAVPVGDGTFLEYGTATGDAVDAVERLVASDAVPQWESVRMLRSDDDVHYFELTLKDTPVLSTIAAYGGSIDEARVEDGDYWIRLRFPSGADVRAVVGRITEAFPDLELVSQRQVDRDRASAVVFESAVFELLTERQRAAIEAAYYAGYFAWPRDTTGEAIAASLDISAPTFHQHLRTAQQQLFRVALEEEPT